MRISGKLYVISLILGVYSRASAYGHGAGNLRARALLGLPLGEPLENFALNPSEESQQPSPESDPKSISDQTSAPSNTGQYGRAKAFFYNNGPFSAYYCEVSLGYPKQTFRLFMDTGSADVWVVSKSCRNQYCSSKPRRFDKDKSTTYKVDNTPWEIRYADGSYASGFQGIDAVGIGGLTIRDQTIAVATSISAAYAREPIDGLFGLGLRVDTVNNIAPPIETIQKQRPITRASFGVYLPRNNSLAEFTFGYYDRSHYYGNLSFSPLFRGQHGWQIRLEGIQVGSSVIEAMKPIVIDSGSALITIGSNIAAAVHANINGATYVRRRGWYIPCEGTPVNDVSFIFSGRRFSIPGTMLPTAKRSSVDPELCYSGIQETPGAWVIGLNWFEFNYVAFDADNKRIGIAPIRG
ncbi:hypothetical protein K7432_010167 [Basidiobolus ranarum]|uniref:Peptidase A1 domain-containing protein n=1 Tax=Basidiobolus ranarum TaxID=34480 RepID=A0ABR2VWT6_9FUNG